MWLGEVEARLLRFLRVLSLAATKFNMPRLTDATLKRWRTSGEIGHKGEPFQMSSRTSTGSLKVFTLFNYFVYLCRLYSTYTVILKVDMYCK